MRALHSSSPDLRNGYLQTARGWRRTAILARHQEAGPRNFVERANVTGVLQAVTED
jgi:hypothetical protein